MCWGLWHGGPLDGGDLVVWPFWADVPGALTRKGDVFGRGRSPGRPDPGTGLGSAVAPTVGRENGPKVPGIDDFRAVQVLGALVTWPSKNRQSGPSSGPFKWPAKWPISKTFFVGDVAPVGLTPGQASARPWLRRSAGKTARKFRVSNDFRAAQVLGALVLAGDWVESPTQAARPTPAPRLLGPRPLPSAPRGSPRPGGPSRPVPSPLGPSPGHPQGPGPKLPKTPISNRTIRRPKSPKIPDLAGKTYFFSFLLRFCLYGFFEIHKSVQGLPCHLYEEGVIHRETSNGPEALLPNRVSVGNVQCVRLHGGRRGPCPQGVPPSSVLVRAAVARTSVREASRRSKGSLSARGAPFLCLSPCCGVSLVFWIPGSPSVGRWYSRGMSLDSPRVMPLVRLRWSPVGNVVDFPPAEPSTQVFLSGVGLRCPCR